VALAVVVAAVMTIDAQSRPKLNIAHRGASAYAPEGTLAAYRLALEMNADFVEPDLAVTKDGVLVCLHGIDGGPPDFPDLTRTTDIEERFPDRGADVLFNGKMRRMWLTTDLTLAEIKTLDAGSWFDKKFAGERIPTFQEMIDLVKGKKGVIPELKAADFYHSKNIDFEKLVVAALDKNGLLKPGANPATPVVLQTFSEASLKKLKAMDVQLPLVLLIYSRDAGQWGTPDRVAAAKKIGATGLGPSKVVLDAHPELVKWAHDAGLDVTAYTFTSTDPGRFPNVKAQMEYFLYTLGVDAVFTNNPDQFPRR
jgi:glycerophosphoryl diester phosphodiesterase